MAQAATSEHQHHRIYVDRDAGRACGPAGIGSAVRIWIIVAVAAAVAVLLALALAEVAIPALWDWLVRR